MPDQRGSSSLAVLPGTHPTFYAVFDRIAVANNKYMATLFNTSATRIMRVTHVWRFAWQVAVVTGALKDQYLARITARTAGTGVTIHADDPSDTLSAGMSADTNSSSVSESHIMLRAPAVSEEMILVAPQLQLLLGTDDRAQSLAERIPGQRGILLRQNEGVTVRNITSGTAGTVSYIMEFFDLPA